MSKFFFEKFEQGYKGTKKSSSIMCCDLAWCDKPRTKYKGVGSRLCEEHQANMREYGGTGRTDRPWTFNKKHTCELCGFNPMEQPLVKRIKNELVKFRTAMSLLVVDHIKTQRDGGTDAPDNVQTLCVVCNEIKTVLHGDRVPRALYNDEADYQKVHKLLDPICEEVFS
tara:strand:- start:1069 stop:1575 length:507 start_codon:yes stop_codon:yes gene_type:complete